MPQSLAPERMRAPGIRPTWRCEPVPPAGSKPAPRARFVSPPPTLITRFRATRPRYELTQKRSLEGVTLAHAQAEASGDELDDASHAAFASRIARVIGRCACPPEKIDRRGVSILDASGGA